MEEEGEARPGPAGGGGPAAEAAGVDEAAAGPARTSPGPAMMPDIWGGISRPDRGGGSYLLPGMLEARGQPAPGGDGEEKKWKMTTDDMDVDRGDTSQNTTRE